MEMQPVKTYFRFWVDARHPHYFIEVEKESKAFLIKKSQKY